MRSNRILAHLILTGLVLSTYRGQLALWEDDNPEPIAVYPTSVCMLPEADRQRLEDGIPVENESRLHRLLEDYLS